MRRDIHVNTQIGDMVLHDQNVLPIYPFQWVKEDELLIYGEIVLPGNSATESLYNTGVRIQIPYTPVYKPIRLRIVRDFGGDNKRAIQNPVTGNEWYGVCARMYNQQNKEEELKASQLLTVSREDYIVQLDGGLAYVWSGKASDLQNIDANIQNRNLLLQCIPSNSYRFPVSGVGLIKYLHSNVEQSGLADRLRKEFAADGVTVIDAEFNSYTGDLKLNLDFNQVEEDDKTV